MRVLPAVLVLVCAFGSTRAGAQTGSTTTTLPPQPPAEYKTTVKGTVPDLTGRWVAVSSLEIPGGGVRTMVTLLEVGRRDGQPDVRMPYVHLPTEQNTAIEAASAAGKGWEPTAGDLATLASWDQLEPLDPHPARLDNYLTGRDAFDETFTGDPRVRDAQWVLQQTEVFDARSAPAVRQVNVFSILEARDDGYRGNYTTTLLAAAPFPIPITFNGTFRLIRLDQPRQGVLTRFADLFRGCRH